MQQQTNLRSIANILKWAYGIATITGGVDKFIEKLTVWEKYLHPSFVKALPFSAHTFMMISGVIEIIAGLLVLVKPVWGGYAVAACLVGIALTLIPGEFYDVMLCDLTMAAGAIALSKLSAYIEDKTARNTMRHRWYSK